MDGNDKDDKDDNDNNDVDGKTMKRPMECDNLLPQKRFYRQRAHSNPIADHCFDYPIHPSSFDWSLLYPKFINSGANQDNQVRMADIGCGYGGLLVELSSMFPRTLILGMEIRVKVCDYVSDRIKALRHQNPGKYENIACLRTNAMKYLPNYFHKGQLDKMFFLFPDPHFKKQKHKWRIISQQLLSEYAYCLRLGATVYTATDVLDLHKWMEHHFDEHPLFARMEQHVVDDDPIVPKLGNCSEESQKVIRKGGNVFIGVYKRIDDPYS